MQKLRRELSVIVITLPESAPRTVSLCVLSTFQKLRPELSGSVISNAEKTARTVYVIKISLPVARTVCKSH